MPIAEDIEKLDVSPGDTVVVTLGGDIAGEQWIPSQEDMQDVAIKWKNALPDSVEVIVMHQFYAVDIIHPVVSCTTWPPKVKP